MFTHTLYHTALLPNNLSGYHGDGTRGQGVGQCCPGEGGGGGQLVTMLV